MLADSEIKADAETDDDEPKKKEESAAEISSG